MLQVIPQVSAHSSVHQPALSTPRNLAETIVSTSVQQPSTPIPGVSTTPISTAPQVTKTPISQQIPQIISHQPRPTVQTNVQIFPRKPGTSTIVKSQPYTGQFFYQTYQGQYRYENVGQNPVYQLQPYPGYTYQIPTQPQYVMSNPDYP